MSKWNEKKKTNKLNKRLTQKSSQFPGLMLNKKFLLELKTLSLDNSIQHDKVNLNCKHKSNRDVKICCRICSNFQELGCARIPTTVLKNDNYLFVDQATGLNSGLVNGDYLRFEFISTKKQEKTVNLDVCLRGFKGMHLLELSSKRAKYKSWKFCFYQAITALLAKTQLRYKYAWSGNVDYIYDHAWMLFIHTGLINVKRRQRLNDVVVYNYKYNIELELVDELKDIYPITDSNYWNQERKYISKKQLLNRNELMHIPGTLLGSKKNPNLPKISIHKTTKSIEEWFDKIDLSHMNCILKTSIFCLAFWRDGHFWYLYNPFRCNEFGFWDDYGYNCIMKFCSIISLKRHLIILLTKIYYTTKRNPKMNINDDFNQKDDSQINKEHTEGSKKLQFKSANVFKIQIFKINFYCCKLHNVKSCQNIVFKYKLQTPERQINEKCNIEYEDLYLTDDDDEEEAEAVDVTPNKIENLNCPQKVTTIPWLRFSKTNDNEKKKSNKMFIWNHYSVEEKDKLFSLQTHISHEIFPEKNGGKYFYACYVICAGMTRLISPEYWISQTLNAILFFGDIYYTFSILLEEKLKSQTMELSNTATCINYLSEEFKIGNFAFQLKVFPASYGQYYNKYTTCLRSAIEKCFSKSPFGILTCKNACLGLFKDSNDAYYIFDVRSINSSEFLYEKGTAFLLRATNFHKFMKNLILLIDSTQYNQFALNPIKIFTILDLDNSVCSRIKNIEDELSQRPKKKH